MSELAQGQIGASGNYKLEFKEGKLQAEILGTSDMVEGGIVLKIKAEAVLEALKNAIPGHFDDALIDGAKALLLKG